MELTIEAEWQAVKDVPSLFKHYGTQREYQKWRERFVRAGYLTKHQRRLRRTKEEKLAYNRAYYTKWRPLHKDLVLQYTHDHWKRKLGFVEPCVQTQ
jgi:hypothetical protein